MHENTNRKSQSLRTTHHCHSHTVALTITDIHAYCRTDTIADTITNSVTDAIALQSRRHTSSDTVAHTLAESVADPSALANAYNRTDTNTDPPAHTTTVGHTHISQPIYRAHAIAHNRDVLTDRFPIYRTDSNTNTHTNELPDIQGTGDDRLHRLVHRVVHV